MLSFLKNKQLAENIEEFLKVTEETLSDYQHAIKHMLKNGMDERFSLYANKTGQNESRADDVRRKIEADMYEQALLPETREDILNILEMIDTVPTQARRIVDMFITQKTPPLPDLKKEINELVKLSVEAFSQVTEATRACIGKMHRIKEFSKLVDNNESLGDHIEKEMITKIFKSKIDTGEKLLQKDITIQLGSMLDLAEKAMDLIVILSIKRHI